MHMTPHLRREEARNKAILTVRENEYRSGDETQECGNIIVFGKRRGLPGQDKEGEKKKGGG